MICRDRHSIVTLIASIAGFAVTLVRPDPLPAVPHVEQVLYSSFDIHVGAGLAVLGGSMLLLVPAIVGWQRDAGNRATYAAFGAVWFAQYWGAARNYPTPIVMVAAPSSATLSLLTLPKRAGVGAGRISGARGETAGACPTATSPSDWPDRMSATTNASKDRRAARLMMARPYRYWLFTMIIVALMYYAWGEVTRTRGVQKVSFRPAAEACGTSGALRYCVYRDRRGTNGDIVYHMHGRNLDERIWNDDTYMTALIQSDWQRRRELPPTVVTLSYGPTWLLTPKGEKPDSGLLNDLMARLPAIEAKIGSPRRRLLVGESMGGLNVLIAGLSYPSRFAKVAALCPGVYSTSPFASLSTIRTTMERTGRSQDHLRRMDDGAQICVKR
jgi:hypothetical protein